MRCNSFRYEREVKAEMTNYVDYHTAPDVLALIQELSATLHPAFDPKQLGVIYSPKESRAVMRITAVKYPVNVWLSTPFIVEVFENKWSQLSREKKWSTVNLIIRAVTSGKIKAS